MLILSGIAVVACGIFVFSWYRTLVSLPEAVRPVFVRLGAFKWGVPTLSLLLFVVGLGFLEGVHVWLAVGVFAGAVLVTVALVRFDRYTANMRIIYDRYCSIRAADPALSEVLALYLVAEWRYPDQSQDRLVELIAGKEIESLLLLMVIKENNINPISDWDLYRSLKAKASRIVNASPCRSLPK